MIGAPRPRGRATSNALWRAIGGVYGASWRFMVALPVIALATIAVEGLQHLIEWRSGFYISFAGMNAGAHEAGRMISGYLKIVWLSTVGYWTTRYLVSGSARQAMAFDFEALRRYALVFAFNACLAAALLFGADWLPTRSGRSLGGGGLLVAGFLSLPLGVALTPWVVGAALGDRRVGIAFSLNRARGSIMFGLALTIFAPLPLMMIHYALGYGAVGRAPWLAIGLLTADAALTGFLGVVLNMSSAVVAQHMAFRAGEVLQLGKTGPGARSTMVGSRMTP